MNREGKGKIEYLDYTWNPVTGCLHGCEYCYARKIVHRFSTQTASLTGGAHDLKKMGGTIYPFGFDPTFHRYRLEEPQKVKKPSIIGVVFMGDLFGDWVPDEWIQEVFEACEKAPQHTYLFLTKNPSRYNKIINYVCGEERGFEPEHWDNMWFGSTITSQDNAERADDLSSFSEGHKFISLEPLLGKVKLDLSGKVQWVIIGAETGNRKGKVVPKREWIEKIVEDCKFRKVPLFMKNSLKDIWDAPLIQEWPEWVRI